MKTVVLNEQNTQSTTNHTMNNMKTTVLVQHYMLCTQTTPALDQHALPPPPGGVTAFDQLQPLTTADNQVLWLQTRAGEA